RVTDRLDKVREVRIVGEGTDLVLDITDRPGLADDGTFNMPGGEVFYSPVEDKTEGTISFTEFPVVQQAAVATGVRLTFRAGRVVDVHADTGMAELMEKLDQDDGARVVGELGIGCNPGITRHVGNALFDEKIAGTVHIALGQGFPFLGGTNNSSLHW